MAKVEAIHTLYPDAFILNINRSPGKTIPSAIALNNAIYRFFTSRVASQFVLKKTEDILITWYQMAEKNISLYFENQHKKYRKN